MQRRLLLSTLGLAPFFAILAATTSGQVQAQGVGYPNKPVKIVVPYPAGGTSDLLARQVSARLAQEWSQPVIVENRPGAGANIGAQAVAVAAPDGYTLLLASSTHAVNASLFKKLPYDPVKDLAPISLLASTSLVVVSHPSVPAKNIRELISYARANPDKLSYSSAGSGSPGHLAAELFKSMAGINLLHVPYKGAAPAITDLVAGQVQLSFALGVSALPYVKDGRLRALAVTPSQRLSVLPDVPTLAESGLANYEVTSWNGLMGPAGMPAAIVQKIHDSVVRIMKDPQIRRSLADQGTFATTNTPAEFDTFFKSEIVKWAKVVKDSGAEAE
jgi:tripartite-type tricarboxylate transporter receptor subunit TctC